MTEQLTPVRTYVLVCAALLVLTVLTYAARFFNLGPMNTLAALAIAAAKATLIILFFMHARFSTGILRIVMVGGLLWLGILVLGTLDDYISRGWLGVPGK